MDIFEGTEQIQQLVISRAISGLRIEYANRVSPEPALLVRASQTCVRSPLPGVFGLRRSNIAADSLAPVS